MATFEKMNRADQLLEGYYPHKPGWYIAYGWFYDRVLDTENDEWILDPDSPEGKKAIEELLPQAWVGARCTTCARILRGLRICGSTAVRMIAGFSHSM